MAAKVVVEQRFEVCANRLVNELRLAQQILQRELHFHQVLFLRQHPLDGRGIGHDLVDQSVTEVGFHRGDGSGVHHAID